jgi:hypothetical protein
MRAPRLVCVCLAVLLISQSAFQKFVRSRPLEFAVLAEGAPLPRVEGFRPIDSSHPTFSEVISQSCVVLHFYTSTCSASHAMARRWQGLDSVSLGRSKAAVIWVGIASDTASRTFLHNHGLRGAGYTVRGMRDWAVLGVSKTPTIYLIDSGHYLGELPADPALIESSSLTCTSNLHPAGPRVESD